MPMYVLVKTLLKETEIIHELKIQNEIYNRTVIDCVWIFNDAYCSVLLRTGYGLSVGMLRTDSPHSKQLIILQTAQVIVHHHF